MYICTCTAAAHIHKSENTLTTFHSTCKFCNTERACSRPYTFVRSIEHMISPSYSSTYISLEKSLHTHMHYCSCDIGLTMAKMIFLISRRLATMTTKKCTLTNHAWPPLSHNLWGMLFLTCSWSLYYHTLATYMYILVKPF